MLKRRSALKPKRNTDGRFRSPGYRAWVRGFQCCIEGKADHECDGPIVFAHVRTGTDGGVGLKPSDFWGVPCCDSGHRLQHQIGETAFENRFGVDLKAIAKWLWNHPRNVHRRRYELTREEV